MLDTSPDYFKPLFSLVYHVMWFMHHDPLAHTLLYLQGSKSNKNGRKNAPFGQQQKALGLGVTAFGGLLEYSCTPNLYRVYVSDKSNLKGKILYKAKDTLSKGAKLTIGWGYSSNWRDVLNNILSKHELAKEENEFSQYLKLKFGIDHKCDNCPKPEQDKQKAASASQAPNVGSNPENSATSTATTSATTSATSENVNSSATPPLGTVP